MQYCIEKSSILNTHSLSLSLIFSRDKKETPKEMTEEERRALVNSENRRLNRDLQYQCPSSSTTSSYSTLRSKEKGLKIYLNHEE